MDKSQRKEKTFMSETKHKCPVRLMTDEELLEFEKEQEKEKLLNELMSASNQKTTRFSVKKNKNKNKEKPKLTLDGETDLEKVENSVVSLGEINLGDKPISLLSDKDWTDMMDEFDDISPIDDITYEDRMRYRRKSNGDKYDEMFNKEQSMLNDLLSGLQKRSKAVDKKLDSMTGKGTYGVGKNYADLLAASNSLESTKLSVIKELVGIKKTAADLRMKESKLNGENEVVEDRDTIADRFYKSIIGGSSKDFIRTSLSSYDDGVNIQNYNISQPFNAQEMDSDGYRNSQADKYGYIQNETRNVSLCLCQYDDGTAEFVAVDEEGVVVPGYELPSPNLIETMSIKPGSAFAYDEYSRKYKIVSPDEITYPEDVQDNSYVPLDDIDVADYDDISNDDKYSYGEYEDDSFDEEGNLIDE